MKKLYEKLIFSLVVLALLLGISDNLQAQQTINHELIKSYFKQMDSLCSIDNGKLWGIKLYGPTMFVMSDTRSIIANQADIQGKLTEKDGLFIGTLPDNVNIANTSLDWNGNKWTMVGWNYIPQNDNYSRNKLLIHESWHRVQDKIGIPATITQNTHLDGLQGSILLKSEFRALSKALTSKHNPEKIAALKDALCFRTYRQLLFPKNNENEFERHEGMAEYTGYKLCGLNSGLIPRVLAKQLKLAENNDGLANSFAYLTGSSYGVLLDDLYPGWLKQILAGQSIPAVIIKDLKIEIPMDTSKLKLIVEDIGSKYDTKDLITEETSKFKQQEELINYYKQKFINGKKLLIRNDNLSFNYNPQEKLIPIDNMGVVYKTMRLTGEFGILEVKNGILRSNDWQVFMVSAPKIFDTKNINEDDYTLTLNKEWSVVKVKEGIFTIKKSN